MAGFWRPGADAPSTSAPSTLLTLDVDADADATGTLIRFEKNPKASLSARRRALPIAAHAHELMYCVEKLKPPSSSGTRGAERRRRYRSTCETAAGAAAARLWR